MRRALWSLLALLLAGVTSLSARTITTVAGGGPDGVPAISAPIWPVSLTSDAAGNIYFISLGDQRIFRIEPGGLLTVAAGTGIAQDAGDGQTADRASLYRASLLAADAAGNLFVYQGGVLAQIDEPCPRYYSGSFRVRRIDAISRLVSAVTDPNVRYAGEPVDLVLDASGDLYLSLFSPGCYEPLQEAGRVWRIDPATGLVTHVAGNGSSTGGPLDDGLPATDVSLAVRSPALAFGPDGDLLLSDREHLRIREVDGVTGLIGTYAGNGIAGCDGDGGSALGASLSPLGITSDAIGNLFISNECARIRRVDAATGIITHVAGNGTWGYSGDGGPAAGASIQPYWIHVDAAGNLYAAGQGRIRRIDSSTQVITTIAGTGADFVSKAYAGDGGPATQARLSPVDVAIAGDGDLFIADGGSSVRRVDVATGTMSTVLWHGYAYTLSGIAVNPAGELFGVYYSTTGDAGPSGDNIVFRIDTATGALTQLAGQWYPGFEGDGGPASLAALHEPRDIAFDAAGNLFIADTGNDRIRRVDASTGIITTVAGGGGGDLGDGGPAVLATLMDPSGVEVDPAGDLLIADTGHNRIRRVDAATGIITTVAGTGAPGSSGDGGPAPLADVTARRIAVDRFGGVFVSGDARVRRIDTSTGIITTVAGNGTTGFYGDGGPGPEAALGYPNGMAADETGALFMADTGAGRIRRLDAPPEPPNAPPVAAASASGWCAAGGTAQFLLDGSASSDPDSSPGTNDDIVLYEWFENDGLLGTGQTLRLRLADVEHVFTLRVTDRASATSTTTAEARARKGPRQTGQARPGDDPGCRRFLE